MMIESENIESIVKRIHLFNHVWKTFQERYGESNVFLTKMLVQQKSDLQNSLVRNYKDRLLLSFDQDAGEGIVSIVVLPDSNCTWKDAAHIPFEHLEYQFQSLVQGERT